ncbi:hypothetical protein E2C01_064537 [Portunus trituberculatus]|uniref:Uncharacterized protein n=1 Tax=Portunus trituberculatus TaxID=210409 RepID=A0A5B7HJE1_PORTR|nr:hypothetical protein [Portunus trituberculatus]
MLKQRKISARGDILELNFLGHEWAFAVDSEEEKFVAREKRRCYCWGHTTIAAVKNVRKVKALPKGLASAVLAFFYPQAQLSTLTTLPAHCIHQLTHRCLKALRFLCKERSLVHFSD